MGRTIKVYSSHTFSPWSGKETAQLAIDLFSIYAPVVWGL